MNIKEIYDKKVLKYIKQNIIIGDELIMNEIEKYNESIFESIKHIDDNECEFWYARELQKALEYSK